MSLVPTKMTTQSSPYALLATLKEPTNDHLCPIESNDHHCAQESDGKENKCDSPEPKHNEPPLKEEPASCDSAEASCPSSYEGWHMCPFGDTDLHYVCLREERKMARKLRAEAKLKRALDSKPDEGTLEEPKRPQNPQAGGNDVNLGQDQQDSKISPMTLEQTKALLKSRLDVLQQLLDDPDTIRSAEERKKMRFYEWWASRQCGRYTLYHGRGDAGFSIAFITPLPVMTSEGRSQYEVQKERWFSGDGENEILTETEALCLENIKLPEPTYWSTLNYGPFDNPRSSPDIPKKTKNPRGAARTRRTRDSHPKRRPGALGELKPSRIEKPRSVRRVAGWTLGTAQ